MGQGNIVGKGNYPAASSAKGVWSLREQEIAHLNSAWPGNDPQWANTKLLLKTQAPAADTFIDSSVTNATITRYGDTIQTTATPYAPYWSNYFDGSGDSLSLTSNSAFAPGTGNFTLECWINPGNWSATYSTIFVVAANGGLWLGKNGSNFVLRAYAVADQISYATLPTTGVWTHIAVVRSGTTLSMYFNGTRVATTTNSYNFVQGTAYIGDDGGGSYFTGNISGLRLVNGTAVYDPTQATLTVPAAPLTAITNTTLLTCQDNRFKDNSTNNFAITRTGDVAVSRFAPFAWTWSAASGGSAYYDGSGDYLGVPDSTNLVLGTGDFTIELWVNLAATGTALNIMDFRPYSTNGNYPDLYYNGSVITYYVAAGDQIVGTTVIQANAWNHIALCRSGTTTRLFVNGVLNGSFTDTTNYLCGTSRPLIGGHGYLNSSSNSWNGSVAGVRVVKGTALYTTAFTPPTTPPTAVPGTGLLLNFTNAAFFDTSGLASVVRQYGTTVSRGKSGPGTELTNAGFAVNGDYLMVPSPSGNLGAGDFTVEGWVYPIARIGTYPVMWCNYSTWTTGSFGLFIGHNSYQTKYSVGVNGSYPVIIGTSDIVYGKWAHLAVVRSNGVITLYVNGVSEGTYSSTATLNQAGSSFVAVPGDATSNSTFGGFISNLRVERSARYTANFTPSTAPHVATRNTMLILNQTSDTWDATGRNNFANTGAVAATPAILTGSALSLSGSQVARINSATLSTDFAFGTGDFTIEGWIFPTSNSGDRCIFCTRGNQANAVYFGHYTSSYQIGFYTASAWQVVSNVAVPPNVWSHVACVRASGVVYLYINGKCVGSAANTTNLSEYTASVGRSVSDGAYGYIGQIAELRVTKAARYTGNFTVSPTPYSQDWEPPYNDVFYASNSVLVKTIDLPGATNNVFRDGSANNFLPVRYGDVTQGTLSPYVPTGYWSGTNFGGSNRITAASNTAFEYGTGDFTIEGWIMPLSWGNGVTLFCHWDGGGTARFAVGLSNTSIGFDGTYGMTSLTGNYACNAQLGLWHHVAVTRQGSAFRLFLNGNLVGTATYSGSYSPTGVPFHIGGYADGFSTGTSQISNLRIVKGTALYTTNFTPPSTPLTAISGTSLLACQDNRFLDRSTNKFSFTVTGTPAITRSAPYPFSTPATTVATTTPGSLYFDGSGDYLTVPYSSAFDLSSGDWTMECWFNAASFGGWHLVSKDTYGSNFDWSLGVANNTTLILYTNRTASSLTATVPAMSVNTWNHVAFVRQSGTNRIYLNGVQYATNTMAITNESQSYVTIGCYGWNSPSGYFPGYLSNLRIVKGTAVYPNGTTFTPPQTLTAVSGTSLLTAQNEFSIRDSSSSNLTLTRYGDVFPTHKTPSGLAPKAMTYTYGGSGYFDGSGDYLQYASTGTLNFGTGDFTVECWINLDVTTRSQVIISGTSSGSFGLRYGTGYAPSSGVTPGLGIYKASVVDTEYATFTFTPGQWYHVAVTRQSGTIKFFVNGVMLTTQGSGYASYTVPTETNVRIGASDFAGEQFGGHISNLRVVKGTAVYTSTFTPPTTPVTAINDTSLLLNFDNAGVYDATGTQNLYTKNSVASSSVVRKNEIATLAFNGAANASTFPATSASNFVFGTGDFTIEFWLYRNGTGQEVFYDQRPQASQAVAPTIYCEGATLYYFVSGGNQINGGTLNSGTWYHIAVSRAASQTRLFVNGTQVGSTYADTNSYTCAAGRPFLGNSTQEGSTAYANNSYIEGLRVSRVGRYTANFTVPSDPFPLT